MHFCYWPPIIEEPEILALILLGTKKMLKLCASILASLAVLTISGCTTPPTVDQSNIDELALEIRKLGPEVDPREAERAARIAYEYSSQLAIEYEVTDPPLVHNYKVNNGFRERGICVHWAEDVEKRLKQENFRTLAMHRAIALPKTSFNVEHSTAVISRRGDAFDDGIVLDPWRYGGVLYWSPTLADSRYNWQPQIEALEEMYRTRQATREAAINL